MTCDSTYYISFRLFISDCLGVGEAFVEPNLEMFLVHYLALMYCPIYINLYIFVQQTFHRLGFSFGRFLGTVR